MIANPPFYGALEEAGIGIPLDFRGMTGITFIDTVLISQVAPVPEGEWLPLLFHELVHVLRYQELGLEKFVRVYVMGWAAACGRALARHPVGARCVRTRRKVPVSAGAAF